MNNAPLASSEANNDWLENYEGQLAIDAYQTPDEIIIRAPIAGVKSEDLEIAITDDIVNIKGERKADSETHSDSFFAQECYWGTFSRSYILPIAVNADKAEATMTKNGVLIIKIPKLEKSQSKTIEIKTEE
jgi:HSP20 family protein